MRFVSMRSFRPEWSAAWLMLLLSACANISDDPRARTPGAVVDDAVLERVVASEVRAASAGLKAAHLVVVCYNGTVLLLGQVAEEADREQAEAAARGVSKARRVINELTVGERTSLFRRTGDTTIGAKVKARLRAAEDVPGQVIKVEAENRVVYLMGSITREEAERAVAIARLVSGIERIVKIFDYID